MTAAAALRRGWCPGAHRPMATGDGLLVRIRVVGGILGLAQAAEIAECARAFGNGFLDLTSRANLQVRGVSDATLPPLLDRLADLGLLDADPEAEAVRNIVASPLAGLDPTAVLDIRRVVRALDARLGSDPALRGLPAKFGFLVDDGGARGLDDVDADVRFRAFAGPEGVRFAVRVGGGDEPIGAAKPDEVPDVAADLARTFLAARGSGPNAPRRMRDLAARLPSPSSGRRWPSHQRGSDEGSAAGSAVPRDNHTPRTGPLPDRPSPDPAVPGLLLAGEGVAHLVVAAPFGRLSADDLGRLAAAAERTGAQDLRLTPWRTLVAAGLPPCALESLAAELAVTGLSQDPVDPRLRVAACPGATACPRGTIPTLEDASALAPLVAHAAGRGVALHVSGCPKGCARSAPARYTLVGAQGRYDLVRDGTAGDPAFAKGLAVREVAALIAAETGFG